MVNKMVEKKKYDNNMSGVLFKNQDKGDNEKAPDFVGSAQVDGVDYRLSGWRQVKKGTEEGYIKIKIQLPFKKDGKPAEAPAKKAAKTEFI